VISVTLQLDGDGCLRRLQSLGHAGGRKDANLVCAAATALMRTTSRVLGDHASIVISGRAPSEGALEITVEQYGAHDGAYLLGVTDVLVRGLEDLSRDEPAQVQINWT